MSIHSLEYLRSPTFGHENIGIRKSEFVAKTHFLRFFFDNWTYTNFNNLKISLYEKILFCCVFEKIFVGSNNLCLKYHRFTLASCKDTKIRKFEFVAKTQFLYQNAIDESRDHRCDIQGYLQNIRL